MGMNFYEIKLLIIRFLVQEHFFLPLRDFQYHLELLVIILLLNLNFQIVFYLVHFER